MRRRTVCRRTGPNRPARSGPAPMLRDVTTSVDGPPRRSFRIRVLQHEPDPEPIWPLPLPRPAVDAWWPGAAVVPVPEPPAPDPAVVRAARAADLAERRAIGESVGLILEVVGGRVPALRLARIAAPQVQRYAAAATHRADLRRAVGTRRPAGAATGDRVCSLRIDRPADGVAEVAAVCRFGRRVRAMACRFELLSPGRHAPGQGDARWTCVALRLG
ncbi:Rv3235 family protein [Pseudonocardia sulfidoxydans]|uniref:Rv3235 family protein n=1 Tax=Pseudonocardia sulfidoxydans TaxID=54011 RepID=UPI00361C2CC6